MTWLKRNWRYFAIFGGLASTIGIVSLLALIDSGSFSIHVWFRSLLHIPWGFCLACLFTRLLMLLEDHREKLLAWHWFYGIPISGVIWIALMQEFGFPGDFRHAPDWIHKAKSFADCAGWALGALASGWFQYFCAVRLDTARNHYLRWRHSIAAR